jgi:hypothetical protein
VRLATFMVALAALCAPIGAAEAQSSCASSEDCLDDGRCTTDDDGWCIAGSDFECTGARRCHAEGRCTAIEGACVAIDPADCLRSWRCRAEGLCYLNRNEFVAD